MRAIRIIEAGKPIVEQDVPLPSPEEGEVLIKIGACGVCYRDLLDAKGAYPFLSPPVTSGHEFAGEVVAVGEKTHMQIGDRVINMHFGTCETGTNMCQECKKDRPHYCQNTSHMYGVTNDGGYAEYVVCRETSLIQIPKSIPFQEACFLYCTAAVAFRALHDHARLQKGERVLVTGATGGVGIHAIQIIKNYFHGTVVAVTTSEDKVELLKKYGADEVLITRLNNNIVEPFDKQLSEPVDVALELTGEPTFHSSLRSLRPGGRIVVVGNITTSKIPINPGFFITREIQMTGSRGATRSNVMEVIRMVERGQLKPVIAATFPLRDAIAAQQMLKDKKVCGRVVLIPSSQTPKSSL